MKRKESVYRCGDIFVGVPRQDVVTSLWVLHVLQDVTPLSLLQNVVTSSTLLQEVTTSLFKLQGVVTSLSLLPDVYVGVIVRNSRHVLSSMFRIKQLRHCRCFAQCIGVIDGVSYDVLASFFKSSIGAIINVLQDVLSWLPVFHK